MRRLPLPILVLTVSFVLREHNPVSALSFLNRKAHDRPPRGGRHDGEAVVGRAVLLRHRRASFAEPSSRTGPAAEALYGQTKSTGTDDGYTQTTQSESQAPNGRVSIREEPPVHVSSIAAAANQHLSMASLSRPIAASGDENSSDRGLSSGGVGTPLARFNNLVNYERYGDDMDDPSIAGATTTTKTLEIHSKDVSGGESSQQLLPPVVNFMDLMTMAFKSATSPEMQTKRRLLVQQLKRHGGYCVVEMDRNDVEARILDNMWQWMDVVLTRGDEGSEEDLPVVLRRQVLKRSSGSDNSTTSAEATDNPGYDFVQTTLVDNELRPTWIEERHGPVTARRAHDAYMLLGQLCKAFATIVYAGSTGTNPSNATRLMESLLNDPYRSMSGSYHRLCKYLPLSQQTSQNGGWGESLRPHVDWTLSTAIPVSDISGLEVYDPSVQGRWVRVEDVMSDDWNRAKQSSRRDVAEGADDRVDTSRQCRWNAHYVVVFAGAWLELLTDGDVESTLHRVVSRRRDTSSSTSNHRQQRLSAPFFMRPKEHVFETMNQVFDDPTNEEFAHLDSREVVQEMGQFLRESEVLRAERRGGDVSNSDIAGESTYR